MSTEKKSRFVKEPTISKILTKNTIPIADFIIRPKVQETEEEV